MGGGEGGLVTSTATYKHNTYTVGRMYWDGSNPATIKYERKDPLYPADVKYTLSNLIGQQQTTIVPTLNYDGGTGHIDLYLDATDENAFYMVQMPEMTARRNTARQPPVPMPTTSSATTTSCSHASLR